MSDAARDDCVLKIERRLKATPDRVFAAWIEPEQVAQWFGPEGMTVPSQTMDPRVGGKWTITMRGPDGKDRVVAGVYCEIDRPNRLAFTWAWLDADRDHLPGHETEVVVELKPDGDGTLLRLTQRTFANEESRDMHNMGWSSSLNGLARLVEG